MSTITVDISQQIAIITLNRPEALNAITPEDYESLANSLREIDKRYDVLVTMLQATGIWFCTGTDVKTRRTTPKSASNVRAAYLERVAGTSTDCGHALYTHSKILVAALNGPVMGITAAFLGYFDFIYCLPNTWLSLPFSFLGLVAEGGSSVSFINRMGLSKANEVLIWGKKLEAEELLQSGFVNKIFPAQPIEDFHASVRQHIIAELEGLDPAALLATKALIRTGLSEKNNPDAVNLRESYAQAERFASGVPSRQFGRIARKEIRHKL